MWELGLIIYKWMNRHTYAWVHSHLGTFYFLTVCRVNEEHAENKGKNQSQPSRNCSQLFCDTIPAKQWQGDMKHSWESRVGVSKSTYQNWLQPFNKPALGMTVSASEFSCIDYIWLFIPLVPLQKTHCWGILSLKLELFWKRKNTPLIMN